MLQIQSLVQMDAFDFWLEEVWKHIPNESISKADCERYDDLISAFENHLYPMEAKKAARKLEVAFRNFTHGLKTTLINYDFCCDNIEIAGKYNLWALI